MILRILVDLLILLLAVLLCCGAGALIGLLFGALYYWDKRLGDLRTLWRRQKTGKLP